MQSSCPIAEVSTDMPLADRRTRFFHLTPGFFVLLLLTVEVLLWLSDRFGWLGWHKGYAVLTSVAVVGMAIIAILGRFGVALVFGRRFQFSLRSLLVLVVAVAVPCTWLAVEIRQAIRQKDGVEAIKMAGNWVTYDFEIDASGKERANPQPPEPAWLRRFLDVELFCDVVEASATTNAAIEKVDNFPGLRTLFVFSPGCGDDPKEVTDVGLACLSGCSHLEKLYLRHTSITDSGLRHVAGLRNLKHLDIQDTKITDAGLENLKGMTRLESLDIRLNDATDVGLRHIQGLQELKLLLLFGTKVTEEGVREFQEAMPKCKVDRESYIWM